MVNRKYGALSSSVNPQELSLSVSAGAKLVLGLLVTIGAVTQVDGNTIIEAIPAAVAGGYSVWQFLELSWGLTRKVIVWFAER